MNRSTPKFLATVLPAALFAAALALAPIQTALAAEDIAATFVAAPFDKVVTKLKREITGHKLVIIKEVPYQQMLGMVGVKSGKMKGFEIFHPRYGKRIYAKDATAFLEVPLRILVSESGGKVELRYRKPSVALAGYSGLSGLGAELDKVFADIVARVAK
jgi:uncharacterized protein (DUF302 family)